MRVDETEVDETGTSHVSILEHHNYALLDVVGHSLYWIMWKAIRGLEMTGLKVVVVILHK